MDPESGATVFWYDAAGNLTDRLAGQADTGTGNCDRAAYNPTQAVHNTYDVMNRATLTTYPDGTPAVDPAFDLRGNLTGLVHGGTDWTYTYNTLNQLKTEAITVAGTPQTFRYTYNNDRSLATLQYPSGLTIGFSPNRLGEPTQVGGYLGQIAYWPDGSLKSAIYENGQPVHIARTLRGLPQTVTYDGVEQWAYNYDPVGNLTAITDQVDDGTSPDTSITGIQYDALNRLTRADYPSFFGVISFDYDPLDNLRTRIKTGQTWHYQYDNTNRLASITDGGGSLVKAFAYDARGNTTASGALNLTFNAADQVDAITGKGSYAYDGHGRRFRITDAASTVRYTLYTQAGQLLAEYRPADDEWTDYLYLGSKLVAETQTAATLPDGPATVTATPNNAGRSIAVSWTADPKALSYRLLESVHGGAWTLAYAGTGLSKSFTGLDGGSYAYRLYSCVARGCTTVPATAATGLAPDQTVLTAPATDADGSFTVSWTAASGATYYNVQRRFNGGSWSTHANNSTTSQPESGLGAGTWDFRVRACNSYGCSGYSALVTTGVLPATPGGLTGPSQNTTGSFTVSWNSATGATRYELQRQQNEGSWSTVYNSSGTALSQSGLGDGNWDYRVRACTSYGCSAWSSERRTIVEIPPARPGWISSPATDNDGTYLVDWPDVSGAQRYELQWSNSSSSGPWTTIYSGTATQAQDAHTSGTHYYQVRACKSFACSAWRGPAQTIVYIGGGGCELEASQPVAAQTPATADTEATPAQEDSTASSQLIPPGC